MLTEGPSHGGRNCSWSSVQSARKYGLKFSGGISMNGIMAEYISCAIENDRHGLSMRRLEERKDKTPRPPRPRKRPRPSQAECDAVLDDLTGVAPAPKRRDRE